jgi:nucleotide-binding universal stress UspA family protein
MFTKILIATDGSDHASHALKYAIESAAKWGAQLIILSVIPPLRPILPDPDDVYPTYIPDFEEDLEKAFKRVLDEAVNTAVKEQPDIEVKAHLKKGRPSDVIMEIARTENVDLIVMGSRGLGGITGSVLGSTSQAVVHSCIKPILIVK